MGGFSGKKSHGFRQRVGVAQAIIHQPKFLILDEPTRGLKPAMPHPIFPNMKQCEHRWLGTPTAR